MCSLLNNFNSNVALFGAVICVVIIAVKFHDITVQIGKKIKIVLKQMKRPIR